MPTQATLDALMEDATLALSNADFTTCEVLCLQALAHARGGEDWDTYLRILRPLQEARRWRRQQMTDEAELRLSPAQATAFLATGEQLGDAMLAACTQSVGSLARVKALEEKSHILPDHEKLHQALAGAVKAVMQA